KLLAAINVTADDCLSGRVRVINNRIDSWRIRRRCWRRGGVRGILNKTFAVAPSIILASTGIGPLLNINFFTRVLTTVANKHPAIRPIETIAERIPQTKQPDFLFQSC